jgi:threonine dehydrogenase-like Zn-dependent dehydrogenase
VTDRGLTAVITEPGTMEQREYGIPDPVAGGMILKMIRANVCGSDVAILNGRHPHINVGSCMGHEGIGVVHALGAGVTVDFAGNPLRVGDRVVAAYFQACRRCRACNAGHWNLCTNGFEGWSKKAEEAPHFHGTYGTHWAIGPNQYVYKVPDNVSSRAASSANCALSQVTFGIELAEVTSGQDVLVMGAGGLGVCASAVANKRGATVHVAEMVATRLPKAVEFGAHNTIDLSQPDDGTGRVELLREQTGGGADVVIDLTGVPSAFWEGVQAVRPGGIFISIGSISPGRFTDFDPGYFTRSGVQMRAALRYPQPVLGRAIDFISRSAELPWETLVDREYTFDNAQQGVDDVAARSITRGGIVFDAAA